jgi:hypothetical protein
MFWFSAGAIAPALNRLSRAGLMRRALEHFAPQLEHGVGVARWALEHFAPQLKH